LLRRDSLPRGKLSPAPSPSNQADDAWGRQVQRDNGRRRFAIEALVGRCADDVIELGRISACGDPLYVRAADYGLSWSMGALMWRAFMSFQAQSTGALGVLIFGGATAMADTLQTHRIPAALAVEAANETIAACAKQGYRETAVVLDADGAVITVVRGDGAGIHTIDSAHDKAYTSVSFKNDTLALAERAKGEDSIAPLAKLPHVMFFGGGAVIKLGDEVIGSIGASGAPGAKLDDGCAHAGLDKIRDRLK
jgi:uncharacterized protein GlcG (DUF336 family)